MKKFLLPFAYALSSISLNIAGLACIDNRVKITPKKLEKFIEQLYGQQNEEVTFETQEEFLRHAFQELIATRLNAYHIRKNLLLNIKKGLRKRLSKYMPGSNTKINKAIIMSAFPKMNEAEITQMLANRYHLQLLETEINHLLHQNSIKIPHSIKFRSH